MKIRTKITIIVLKAVGLLLILVATGIATIQVSHLDDQLDERRNKADKFYADRQLTVEVVLSYEQKRILRRIDIQDENTYRLAGRADAAEELRDRIFRESRAIAKGYASIIAEGQADSMAQQAGQQGDAIWASDLSYHEKLIQLDNLIESKRSEFQVRN